MSVYAQQANNLIQNMPEQDQKFVVEFLKIYSINKSLVIKEKENKPKPLKQAIREFMEDINSTPPLEDDEIDEILNNRINITRDLGDI